jgi:hypothetical protein
MRYSFLVEGRVEHLDASGTALLARSFSEGREGESSVSARM